MCKIKAPLKVGTRFSKLQETCRPLLEEDEEGKTNVNIIIVGTEFESTGTLLVTLAALLERVGLG